MFESRLKDQILEASGSITLNEQQVLALQTMLERLDADPFENGGSGQIDTDDLEKLGLSANGEQKQSGGGDPFDVDGFSNEGVGLGDDGEDDLISPSAAVVAPVATPDHDRDIPEEILQTMQALQSDGEEVPLDSLASQPQAQQPQQQAPQSQPQQQQAPQQSTQGAGGGGETPAEMADAIRQQFANESAPAPAQPQMVEQQVVIPPVQQAPAPAPAPVFAPQAEEPVSWSQVMENYRSAHKANGFDTNVNGHGGGAEKAAKKAAFRQQIASLGSTQVKQTA